MVSHIPTMWHRLSLKSGTGTVPPEPEQALKSGICRNRNAFFLKKIDILKSGTVYSPEQ
jgi:hypothetical protein